MVVQPRRFLGRAIDWRIAFLPIAAIVVTAAFELTVGEDPLVPMHAAQTAVIPPAGASAAAPKAAATASTARFLAPAGVAVRGNIVYVSDVATNAIWAYDSATETAVMITGFLGAGYSGDGGPAGQAQLTGPRGLALDAAGNLFIADSGNHVVRRIGAADRIVTTVAGTGSRGFSGDGGKAIWARLNTPTAVAFDSYGNLYIADTLNHRIRKVTKAGVIVTVAGSGAVSSVGRGTGGFGFSGDGGPAVQAQLSIPEGVAIDSKGNVYIADTGNDRIRKVDTKGIIRTVAGTGKNSYSNAGKSAVRTNLYAPVGMAIGPGGFLYFSERDHHVVRMISARGLVVAVAGRGSRGNSGDGGYATRAKLNDPQGIAFGPTGELFVADTGNQRVREVPPGGTIITIVWWT